MRASFIAWSSKALLLLTVITSLISAALATPLPSSASSTVHILVLPASEPSRPKSIIRPEGDTRRFTLVALSDVPEVQSHNSNIWDSLRALVAIFSPSYSSWPLGSSPSVAAFSSARQLTGAHDTTVNTNSMPSNLQPDRINIQNQYAIEHLLDVALERQIAALEIAREADGYAGPAPGVMQRVGAEGMEMRKEATSSARVYFAHSSRGEDTLKDEKSGRWRQEGIL